MGRDFSRRALAPCLEIRCAAGVPSVREVRGDGRLRGWFVQRPVRAVVGGIGVSFVVSVLFVLHGGYGLVAEEREGFTNI